jgi:hypothetical protein
MLDLQDTIGARQFFEGWVHLEWESLQAQYYKEIKSRRSSKRWTIALITKLWDIAWDLWDFRNAVFHHQHNLSLQEDTSALDDKVRDLIYHLSLISLLPKDKHLTMISTQRLLLLPRSQKIEWIQQVNLALAQPKKRHFQIRFSRTEHLRRHQNMFKSMQILLRNWLN